MIKIPGRIRQGLAAGVGAAGLAYPVCAAICPRGRGACPYPGMCFLYTDADTNSVCDYTARSVSPAPAGEITSPATPALPLSPSVSTPVSPLTPVTSVLPPPADTFFSFLPDPGLFVQDGWGMGLLAAGLVFLVLFLLFRSGISWIRIPKGGPAGAAAALFSLGIGEMITFLLVGEETLASGFAVVYLLAGTLLSAYIWKSGCMSRKVAVATVLMSGLFGFVILAPLMPIEFVGLVTLISPTLTPVIAGLLAGIALVALVGRTFCGHLCPVGSVQELAWNVPGRKVGLKKPIYLEGLRLAIFAAAVAGALYSLNLMEYTGVYAFFSLTVSAGLVVFLLFLVLSLFVYRPVCRGICPFGLIFSLPAHFSLFQIRRTAHCIGCGKCERSCPADVAGRGASKRECYLCARCTAACPVKGALVYGRRTFQARGDVTPPIERAPGKR